MDKNLILVYPDLKGIYKIDLKPTTSLALLYLAGSARDSGVCDSIQIFDFNTPYPEGKTLEQFLKVCPEEGIVGINCIFTPVFPRVRELAKSIKAIRPNLKITTGGMHPTVFAQEIMENCPEFDAVSMGESENTFPNLLRYLWGECDIGELESVAVRNTEGGITLIPRKDYINDLDSVSFPAYEYVDLKEYKRDTSQWWDPDGIKINSCYTMLFTSRSCPNKCSFCSIHLAMGDRYRMRSAESVFNEIKFLYDTYGVNYFYIMDDTFTFDRGRVIDICNRIINSGMKVYFALPNGVSVKTLDRELVEIMRRAGFIYMGIAAESGSSYIRNKVMGKGTTNEQIYDALKWCREFGIRTDLFLIVGMPEETEETFSETRKLVESVESHTISVAYAIPLPKTRLYEQCIRDNLIDGKSLADWSGTNRFLHTNKRVNNADLLSKVDEVHIKPYALSIEKLIELKTGLIDYIDEKLGIKEGR